MAQGRVVGTRDEELETAREIRTEVFQGRLCFFLWPPASSGESWVQVRNSSMHGFGLPASSHATYHRQALGYRSRGAPKDHPEYLVARRGNRLILNIVDANDKCKKFGMK